ncbi:hypothetical protein B0H13DRAFT_2264194 [Mycena leptocephala]|nr:hypothetical protein B0H13DRAFT_2264194 [Mycena leptocephala]
MLKREPAGERLNQSFIPNANVSDRERSGSSAGEGRNLPIVPRWRFHPQRRQASTGTALALMRDMYHRPRTMVSSSPPPFGSSALSHTAITLTRQLWKSVRRRPTKPVWPFSPSLDSWSLSGTANCTFFAGALTSCYHGAAVPTATIRIVRALRGGNQQLWHFWRWFEVCFLSCISSQEIS